MTEEWRAIPGWEGLYEASSSGRIKSLQRITRRRNRWGGETVCTYKERVLSPAKSGADIPYLILQLSDDSGRHTHSVHALVCAAFHGARPAGKQAAHSNGDHFDNRPANLRWATPVENEADKVSHGRKNDGERNGHARLTSGQVSEIRLLGLDPNSRRRLATQFGVSAAHINAIAARRKWKNAA
jgi:hypothetical protein